MPSSTKSLPRRSTCFVWITLISITSTNSTDLDNHWKRENAAILMMTVKLRARSTLECTLGCLHSSHCGSFCMRRSDNTCYLDVEKTSLVQLLGEFSDVKCFSKANCPTAAGYSAYGGRCLKVYVNNVSYITAQGRCSADGGHLYHYKSLVFDREPVRLLLESSGIDWTRKRQLWMGGSDLVKEGDFVWTDGTHLHFNASVWRPGQPSNGGNIEHCLNINTTVYKLNDKRCDSKLPYICQTDM